jgi:hypothetical protein
MFRVNNSMDSAAARFEAVQFLHTGNPEEMQRFLLEFMRRYAPDEDIDLLVSGENGDSRLLNWYAACEELLLPEVTIARFKHMSGEYATATAMALWLACRILNDGNIPNHMIKRQTGRKNFKKILIYNTYKGMQHSFMLVSKD